MRPESPSRRRRAVLVLLGVAIVLAGCTPAGPLDPSTHAVAYVVDGDTLDVTDASGATQRVRVLGINTPEVAHEDEPAQCGGEEAAADLAAMLPEGSTVHLVSDARADDEDRYGRLLRYVETTDGTDVGRALIDGGRAYAWKPRSAVEPERFADYTTATDTARTTAAGSWSACPDLGASR